MTVQFTRGFDKMHRQLSKKIHVRFEERLRVCMHDMYTPVLENHALHGKYRMYRSINITGDYRALYQEISSDSVIFVAIGTHSQLYR